MALQSSFDAAGRWGLGTAVVALYVFFVLSVAFGFGSYMYRSSWETEAPAVLTGAPAEADGRQEIDNMIFILRREKALQAANLELQEAIRELRDDEASKRAEVKLSFGPIARAKALAGNEALLVKAGLSAFLPEMPVQAQGDFKRVTENAQLGPHGQVEALLGVVKAGLTDAGPDVRAAFGALDVEAREKMADLLAQTERANKASHDIQQQQAVITDKINALIDEQAQHDAQIAALREVLPISSAVRARLSSLELQTWFLPSDLVLRLVSFPTIFLTLVVTIAAGGLGTVVAFSRRYYSKKDSDLTLSRLFVNVGEGIAAAMAIFLFSGAGMLALTQGGGASSDVELSPYTVAFVAFLSGFMAEDAFAAIQAAGKRIFNTEEPK